VNTGGFDVKLAKCGGRADVVVWRGLVLLPWAPAVRFVLRRGWQPGAKA
jgi:hypothetical protein